MTRQTGDRYQNPSAQTQRQCRVKKALGRKRRFSLIAAPLALLACSGSGQEAQPLAQAVPANAPIAASPANAVISANPVQGTIPPNVSVPSSANTAAPGAIPQASAPAPATPAAIESVSAVTRFPRLTHRQWRNSLIDLFGLAEGDLEYDLAADTELGLFDTNQARTRVRPQLRNDYEQAAEGIALTLTADRTAIDDLLTAPLAAGQDMGAALAESLASRLYRRPVTATELAELTEVYQVGTTSYEGVDPVVGGARLLLTLLLQSPYFLYRVETSTDVDPASGLIPLNGYELATRVSYLIANTTPDAELLAAAQSGQLTTDAGLQQQLDRLLASPAATRMINNFYAQGLGSQDWAQLSKSTDLYPNFNVQQSAFFEESALKFVQDVALTQRAGLREMLLTPRVFVNQEIAPLYGVPAEGLGSELTPVNINPTERAGLLTQLGFLAFYATDSATDPIHRGNYINNRLICREVPAPPLDIPPLPEDEDGVQTVRERVEFHTSACGGGCHAPLINAAGFAFERYGALGEIRDTDNGQPVNAAATIILDGNSHDYDGAIEFSNKLAESKEVHTCYSKQWLEYALGRDLVKEDQWLIDKTAVSSHEDRTPIVELVAQIASSQSFRTRAPTTLTQENN